ncbi:uroporphyrinogen-III synthase [Sulfitobacter sp. F26169L]|uniref:uroporphyrinogen-III synthase n=1 Tax=Sulfitobacter sp. F26169L TaxID=2996015 RepID=UPI002260E448|nr:uroporphyrinogen-III synthase [Sulfitobacter sp. F26169L]MCX7565857.1 uroporphyrinogen-III synthase [Sulfitobacter sp. F26169L]
MALPTLLLTRTRDRAQAFAQALDPAALGRVRVMIAPLLAISPTKTPLVLDEMQQVIFTSANGVLHAPPGQGRVAFCVGAHTTQQAIAQGWSATLAGDTAKELIATLSKTPPKGPLLHLGGTHTRGDIAQILTASGVKTRHVALYDQTLLPLEQRAIVALRGPCIVPVFSPRTAAHLVRSAKGKLERASVVALSDAVAEPFRTEKTKNLVIIQAPQAVYMRKAVENLCRTVTLP